jgi:hypothetical protein
MNMSKTLGCLAVLWAIALILVWSALPGKAQQEEPQATITVQSVDIPEGQEATILVTVAGVPTGGVVSYQGRMNFDPDVIEIIRVEFPPNCPVRAYNVDAPAGVLIFAATKCIKEGDTGLTEGELFRIIVRAVGPPGSSTTLAPTFEIFINPRFEPIPHRVISGVIRIISGVNQLPTADFDYVPKFPSTRDEIRFIDLSTDPDGRITQWAWEFGDGGTSDQQTASHKYSQGGLFTVKLTVKDNRGDSATATRRLYVFQAPPLNGILILNFPNPASTHTRFLYFLPVGTIRATLHVFNLTGRPVYLADLDVNRRDFEWNLKDEIGNDLPNGPYFYLVGAETPGGMVTSRVEVLVIQR